MTEYFDSHCHLTATAFRDDREAVLHRAIEAGVNGLVTIASSASDAEMTLELAKKYDGVWCTAGVHPHEANDASGLDIPLLRDLAQENPEVVAIGETGLDFYYDNSPRRLQMRLFEEHLTLGAELGLPVVVHAREADREIAEVLREMPADVAGVLHCFTGGPQAFEEAMRSDWYISFSGMVSFKNFDAVSFLQEVPFGRLLVETDSPYLAPVPCRGRRNEPAYVAYVVDAVAKHLDLDVGAVAQQTTDNARRFYGIG